MSDDVISCVCPHCSAPLYAPVELLGTEVECQKCLSNFVLDNTDSIDQISRADTIMDPNGTALAALLAEMAEPENTSEEPPTSDSDTIDPN